MGREPPHLGGGGGRCLVALWALGGGHCLLRPPSQGETGPGLEPGLQSWSGRIFPDLGPRAPTEVLRISTAPSRAGWGGRRSLRFQLPGDRHDLAAGDEFPPPNPGQGQPNLKGTVTCGRTLGLAASGRGPGEPGALCVGLSGPAPGLGRVLVTCLSPLEKRLSHF